MTCISTPLLAGAALVGSLAVAGGAVAAASLPGGQGCIDPTAAPSTIAAPSTTAITTTSVVDSTSAGSVPEGFSFTFADGDLSVVFPAEPELDTFEYTEPAGATATYAYYETPTMEFLAFRYHYPDPASMPTLQQACEGSIATAQATLLSSAPTTVQGYPGIEYLASTADQSIAARVFDGPIAGVRYSVIVTSNTEALTFESPEVATFMGSVAINSPVPSVTTPASSCDQPPTSDAAAAPATVPDDWFPFVDPDGDFTVSFPGEPETTTQDVPLPDGSAAPLVLHSYSEGDYGFVVGVTTYAPGTVPSLEGARDGSLANTGATLVSSEPIELQCHPGIEFDGTITSGGVEGAILSRIYAVDNVQYQLIVVGPGHFGTAAADAFFDSFRFTGEVSS